MTGILVRTFIIVSTAASFVFAVAVPHGFAQTTVNSNVVPTTTEPAKTTSSTAKSLVDEIPAFAKAEGDGKPVPVQPLSPPSSTDTAPLAQDHTTAGPLPVATIPGDVQKGAEVVGATPKSDVKEAVNAAEKIADTDPLAKFREAFGAAEEVKPGTQNDAGVPPTPTPGGMQQPNSTTDPLAGYDMSLNLTPDEIVSEKKRKAKQEAFEQSMDNMMPMSTEQIGILKDKFRETRDASESRIGGAPKPEVSVENVSLEPGSEPPTITLSPDHVTTLNVIDITGQPWPIKDMSWGGNFEVLSPGEGGHIIRISPMGATSVGNLSIQLVNLKTPVIFTLKTDLEHVQYRVDMRVPDYGPNSKTPLVDPGVTTVAGDKTLNMVLDGVPPAGARKYDVVGVDGRTSVVEAGGQSYLRTPHQLLSPGWTSSASSSDGMTVYVIPPTPVVLLSDNGRVVRATIMNAEKTASVSGGK